MYGVCIMHIPVYILNLILNCIARLLMMRNQLHYKTEI